MEILLLRSNSRNFPLDLEPELTTAGYAVTSLSGLRAYISSPARVRPQLLVLEIGSLADLDRALVVVDWNEHVQPLAPARYVLVMASKNFPLGDRGARLASAEVAVLPQPMRNILFKLELQSRLLRTVDSRRSVGEGFAARLEELPASNHRRVLVVRGPSPREGSWARAEHAPTGKIRWRWVKSPGAPAGSGDAFRWHVDSDTAPRFDATEMAWLTESDEDSVSCELEGETLYAAPLPASDEETSHDEHGGKSEKFVPPAEFRAGTAPPSAAQRRVEAAARERPADLVLPPKGRARPAPSAAAPPPAPGAPSATTDSAITATAGAGEADAGTRARNPEARVPERDPSGSSGSEAEEAYTRISASDPEPATEARRLKALSPAATPAPAGGSANERARAALEQAKAALDARAGKKTRPAAEAAARPAPATPAPASPGVAAIPLASRAKDQRSAPAVAGDSQDPSFTVPAAPDPALPAEDAPPDEDLVEPDFVAKHEPETTARSYVKPEDLRFRVGDSSSQESGAGHILGDKNPAQAKPPMTGGPPAEIANEGASSFRTSRESDPADPERPGGPDTAIASAAIPVARERDDAPVPAKEKPPLESPLERAEGDAPENPLAAMRPALKKAEMLGRARPLREEDDPRRFLKTRHYQLMTLEQLGDRDSSWHLMGHYRIYLSAQHRYYGLKAPTDALPLWIYDGELAPEFIDEQRSWKFYDRLPVRVDSLDSLPLEAYESLYRLCGQVPPAQPAPQPRGRSVVVIKNPDQPATDSPARAPAPAPHEIRFRDRSQEGRWGKIKRALRGLLKK